jgi:hypothetical protein
MPARLHSTACEHHEPGGTSRVLLIFLVAGTAPARYQIEHESVPLKFQLGVRRQ